MGNCDPYSDPPESVVSTNQSLLGSRSRRCYAIKFVPVPTFPVTAFIRY
jgi:hypothetical protein